MDGINLEMMDRLKSSNALNIKILKSALSCW